MGSGLRWGRGGVGGRLWLVSLAWSFSLSEQREGVVRSVSVADIEGHEPAWRSDRENERCSGKGFDDVEAIEEELISEDVEPCVATRFAGNADTGPGQMKAQTDKNME